MNSKPPHGGAPPSESLIDFSSNLHPQPPPQVILDAARAGVELSSRYPDADGRTIRAALSEQLDIPAGQILAGPGSSALLYQILLSLKPRVLLLPTPCFSEYPHMADLLGVKWIEHPIPFVGNDGDLGNPPPLPRGVCVILSNPCNPTGKVFQPESILRWRQAVRSVGGWLIVDEAYADFKEDGADRISREDLETFPLVVLRSPLKFFSLPGLRAGFAVMSGELSEKIEPALPPWPLSTPALNALDAALRLDPVEIANRRRKIRSWADLFQKALRTVPDIAVSPSDIHFFLVRLPPSGPDAVALAEQLSREGMWIRTPAGMPALSPFDVRLSTRFPEENGKLIGSLKKIFRHSPAAA